MKFQRVKAFRKHLHLLLYWYKKFVLCLQTGLIRLRGLKFCHFISNPWCFFWFFPQGKFRDFVCTLRLLKNKSLITTSAILCAVDFIFHIDILQKEISIRNLTKKLVMVFIFLISSTQNLNLQDIFHKVTRCFFLKQLHGP